MASPADVIARLDAMDARQLELGGGIQQIIEMQREQERLRGLKYTRWFAPASDFATPAATFTLNQQDTVSSGFVWDLRIIAGKLSASDSVAAYIGENNNGMPIGYQSAPGAAPGQNVFVILIPKSSGIWNAGETLFLQTSGAGNITSLRLAGWQAPGPMLGKLF